MLIYHELDFPITTIAKISAIQKTPPLLSVLSDSPEISVDNSNLHSKSYNIHALDLRDLATADASSWPSLRNLRHDVPTLILSECCLVYLLPSLSARILSTFATRIVPAPTPLALILYEPIHPHDPFGRTMVSNLSRRGIVLESLENYHDLTAQRRRLKDAEFSSGQEGMSVLECWNNWVGEEEKERVAKCEMVDEVEEWELLAGHYSICWGWRDSNDAREERDVFSRAWEALKRKEG